AKADIFDSWGKEAQVLGTTVLRTMFSVGFIAGTGIAAVIVRIVAVNEAFLLIAGAGLVLTVGSAILIGRIQSRQKPRVEVNIETPTQVESSKSADSAVVVSLFAIIVP